MKKLKIENFRERIKTYRELLAEEIISNEEFKMAINGCNFIIKKGPNIEMGESMNIISGKSNR